MLTPEEILIFVRLNRSKIRDYFYNRSFFHPLDRFFWSLKRYELNALFLLTIETPGELCRFFKSNISEVENLINYPPYRHYTIKKKRGGKREIFEPDERLKAFQKHLNYFLQAYYLMIKPAEVHGFIIRPNRESVYCNIFENARVHTGKKYVLNIDLKDFFPGISAMRVRQMFSSDCFQFTEPVATALTLLATFQGKLPTGSPCSPVISNFICNQLDKDLRDFATEKKLNYSRYADDLTFSSDFTIDNDTILDIILLIRKNGFEINEKKLHTKSSCRKQTVTGLVVNEKVNVDRKLIRKIRAMLHDLTTNGLEQATRKHFGLKGEVTDYYQNKFIYRLTGYINFVGQIRGASDKIFLKFYLTMESFKLPVKV